MPTFSYKAVRRSSGEIQQGEMEALNQDMLVRQLQSDGLIPVRVTAAGGVMDSLRRGGRTKVKTLSQKQLSMLTRQLATLLESGLTLDRSMQILHDLSDSEEQAQLLERLQERIHGGATFSVALEAEGALFSRLYINMIRAGEAGGIMEAVLSRLADYLERSAELRESVRSALVYPTILLTVAGLSVILLLMFVVPQFKQMFDDMGQTLPLATRIVVWAGDLFRGYWWVMLAGGLGFAAFFQARLANPEVRYRWDARLLRMPLVSDLVTKVETARFTRTLATLMENGLPLLMAMNLVKDVLSNQVIVAGVGQAVDSLKKGQGLCESLGRQEVIPPLALQMIKVGEESGQLAPMLHKVAGVYDQEVRTTVKRMLTLVEPILIVGLGILVAGIIVSILVAILAANDLAF